MLDRILKASADVSKVLVSNVAEISISQRQQVFKILSELVEEIFTSTNKQITQCLHVNDCPYVEGRCFSDRDWCDCWECSTM
jgi:hypothetical protein